MTASQRSVCVLGGGSFGSTIARLVGAVAADAPVRWWVREAEVADEINTHRSNERFLPGAVFTPNLVAMTDLEAATAGATHLVVAIPSQFLEATLPRVRKHIRADASVLSVVKSLHYEDARNRLSLPSSEILQLLGGTHEVCALCGPNIYHEMTSDASFAEATIGCADSVSGRVAAAQWHALLRADYFATRCIADRSGVEAAGALKNVIALGTGFGTGCGHGANVRAAIMRVGLGEMERFARRFLGAADARTFYEEACGVGDLVLTCTTGRGHQLAAAFVRGDEHTRDVQTPHARWAALEAKLFPGMYLPDWHSAKALKAFLAAHCAEPSRSCAPSGASATVASPRRTSWGSCVKRCEGTARRPRGPGRCGRRCRLRRLHQTTQFADRRAGIVGCCGRCSPRSWQRCRSCRVLQLCTGLRSRES